MSEESPKGDSFEKFVNWEKSILLARHALYPAWNGVTVIISLVSMLAFIHKTGRIE